MVDAAPLDTSWTLTLPTLDGLFAHRKEGGQRRR